MANYDIDLDLIRCFITVVETGSFTLAGERIGRSQSAVSARIKKLEELLDVELLERNSREVSLTHHGQKLIPKAKKLLAEGEGLVAQMRSPVLSGEIRIGILEYIAPHRIPDILDSLRPKLPDADLTFRVGLSRKLLEEFDKGEIDIALALHNPERADSTPIAEDQMMWVCSDSREEPITTSLPVCLMQAPCIYRKITDEVMENTQLDMTEVITANSILAVREAVASGLGVSILGQSALGHGIQAANIPSTFNLPKKPLPKLTIGLYGKDSRKTQLLPIFQQVLKNNSLHILQGGSSGGVSI
ncbi:MAG: LysR family transcriptional regulator [Cellvibrionaceae bacterium]